MSKFTLGRGLGDLLGSDRATQKPSLPARPPGVGLRILIDGAPREPEAAPATAPAKNVTSAATPKPTSAETDRELLVRILAVTSLMGADVALLSWAAHHAFTHQHQLSGLGVTACIGSALLAALCGCAAALSVSRSN